MNLRRSCLLVGALCALAAACSTLPAPAPALRHYDLGPSGITQQPVRGLAQIRVSVPSWLKGRAMSYRRLDEDPGQRREFRDSMWSAPAAELISQVLEKDLADPGGRCVLQVHLDEFGWEYASADRATALIQLRLSLQDPAGAGIAASRVALREPADGRDAGARVKAMNVAVQRLEDDIRQWVDGLDRGNAPGLNNERRCR